MSKWSDHVHKYAKKHKMTYKEAQMSKECKETYKKKNGKLSPRMNGLKDLLNKFREKSSPQRESAGKKPKKLKKFNLSPLEKFRQVYGPKLIWINEAVKDMKRNKILDRYYDNSIVYKPPEEKMKESLKDRENQAYAVELWGIGDRIEGLIHHAHQDGWEIFSPGHYYKYDWGPSFYFFNELVPLIEKWNTLLEKKGYTKYMIPKEKIDFFRNPQV